MRFSRKSGAVSRKMHKSRDRNARPVSIGGWELRFTVFDNIIYML